MYTCLWLLLAIVACMVRGPQDFIHVKSYIELESLFVEQADLPVLMLQHYDNTSASYMAGMQSIQQVLGIEQYGYIVVVVDCVNFHRENSTVGQFCSESDPHKRGKKRDLAKLRIFKPDQETVIFKSLPYRKMPVEELVPNDPQQTVEVLARALPIIQQKLEQPADLNNFLSKSSLDKAVFFVNDIFNESRVLRTLAAQFSGRVDLAVTETPGLLSKYGQFATNSLLLLKYQWKNATFSAVRFNESVNDSRESFLQLHQFLSQHARARRLRYFVMETSVRLNNITFQSREEIVKLAQQEQRFLLLLAYNSTANFTVLQEMERKYGNMFVYGHYDCKCAKFRNITTPALVLVDNDLLNVHVFNSSYVWLNNTFEVRPAQGYRLGSNSQGIGACMAIAKEEQRQVVLFRPAGARDQFFMRYSLRDKLLQKSVMLCNAKFITRESNQILVIEKGQVLSIQPSAEHAFVTSKLQSIYRFEQLRQFLKEAGRKPLLNLLAQVNGTRLEQALSTKQLSRCSGQRYCLILLSSPSNQLHQPTIQAFSKLQKQFFALFQFFWLDVDCHKEVLEHFELGEEALPKVLVYSEKLRKFNWVRGGLSYRELRRWLRSNQEVNHMNLKKTKPLTIQRRKCSTFDL